MTNITHHDAWQYIADAEDTPTECRDTARDLLAQHRRALAIVEQANKRAGEVREHHADTTRNLVPTLRRELTTAKKHSLGELVAQLQKADEMLVAANLEKHYADRLLASIRAQMVAALRQHRSDLLQWIAARRLADIHALGYTELVTPELLHIYEHLGITWQTKWNEGLSLGTTSRLPLVFHPGWIPDAHASAAWVWQHVALGDVRERNGLHYVAAYVDALPHIETPRAATPPRKGFANS